jgi:hypothetical protein
MAAGQTKWLLYRKNESQSYMYTEKQRDRETTRDKDRH